MTDKHWIARRLVVRLVYIPLVALLLHAGVAAAADRDLGEYKELRRIDSFGAVTVTFHSAGTPGASGLTEDNLTDYVRTRFAAYFPSTPFRSASPAELADPGNAGSLGLLACRVWIDEGRTPAVFQVRCWISTAERRNIIEDGSFGYGPPERVADIVRQQIDHLLGGFGGVVARLKSDG